MHGMQGAGSHKQEWATEDRQDGDEGGQERGGQPSRRGFRQRSSTPLPRIPATPGEGRRGSTRQRSGARENAVCLGPVSAAAESSTVDHLPIPQRPHGGRPRAGIGRPPRRGWRPAGKGSVSAPPHHHSHSHLARFSLLTRNSTRWRMAGASAFFKWPSSGCGSLLSLTSPKPTWMAV